jgi:hypothetical protein
MNNEEIISDEKKDKVNAAENQLDSIVKETKTDSQ